MAIDFTELNDDAIDELLSKSRTKGEYRQILADFVAAGVKGAKLSLKDDLDNKKEATAKSGFVSAAIKEKEAAAKDGKGYPEIVVGSDENFVYLVNKTVAKGQTVEAPEPAEQPMSEAA